MRDPIIEDLHRARLRQSASQYDIARRVGVSRSALASWETDAAIPTLPHLRSWSRALGMELELTYRA